MQGKLLCSELIWNLHGQCVFSPFMGVWFSVTNLVRWRLWELHFFSHIFRSKHFQKFQGACKDCNPSGQVIFSIPAPSRMFLEGGNNSVGMTAVLIFPLESLKSSTWMAGAAFTLSLPTITPHSTREFFWHVQVIVHEIAEFSSGATRAWYLLADVSYQSLDILAFSVPFPNSSKPVLCVLGKVWCLCSVCRCNLWNFLC